MKGDDMKAKVNGVELFYNDNGSGAPIVLIPGLGQTHRYFDGIAAHLKDKYRLIALDLRGVGESDKPRQRYDMEIWADDVAGVLEHLGIDQAHVLGSSLGGCVAQAFAVRHPKKLRSLMLAATFSEIDPMLELNYRVRMDLIRQNGMSELFARFAIASLLGRSFYATEKGRADAQAAIGMIQNNDKDMYLEHLGAVLRFGRCEPGQDRSDVYTRRLAEVTCPALVLAGAEDVLTVPLFSEKIAQSLPNARLIVQPGCGHLNLGEQPENCAAHVLQFLSTIE
jgi:pimeloyl-ACP methyl ester carboxylesterase